MKETFCFFFFPRPNNNYPLHFLCFQSFSMTYVKPLTKGCQIVLFLFGCLERESFSTSFIIPDRLGIVKKKKLSWFKPFPVFSMWVSLGAKHFCVPVEYKAHCMRLAECSIGSRWKTPFFKWVVDKKSTRVQLDLVQSCAKCSQLVVNVGNY